MFTLTAKQLQAQQLMSGPQTHTMMFGGSRSGKTFAFVRAVVVRALAAPKSRHAILRFRYNHVIQSIAMDTLPKVMALCFPAVAYNWNKQLGYVELLETGSQLWLGGLDDAKRVEKILGTEFATIYLNECSQIPWASVGTVVTRLAQQAAIRIGGHPGRMLAHKMFYDCNPPGKGHWTYKVFVQKRDPETNEAIPQQANYASMQMNPGDNQANLPESYLTTLQGLSPRLQRRFLHGEFADENPNALFADEDIDKWRVLDGDLPDMQRVVIAVDPSGAGDADNADNDAIGIVVVALGVDGNAYVLEDCSVKAGPKVWGQVAASAFDRHQADLIVAETNFGGAMVEQVIQTARPRTPFKRITASRGKVIRAEPFSALYATGKVRHVGQFRELEDELTAFSTSGYTGAHSPDRADAVIHALSELFPAIVNPRRPAAKTQTADRGLVPQSAWLG